MCITYCLVLLIHFSCLSGSPRWGACQSASASVPECLSSVVDADLTSGEPCGDLKYGSRHVAAAGEFLCGMHWKSAIFALMEFEILRFLPNTF